jgi:hypothetical protein
LWPGSTTQAPKNTPAAIPISFNSEPENPPPAPDYKNGKIYNPGAWFAHHNVKHDNTILPYHIISLHNFGAGASVFEYRYCEERVKANEAHLGHAVMSSGASGMTMGLMTVMADLGIQKPVVGSINTAINLSYPEFWPLFSRIIIPDTFIASMLPIWFKHYGWTQCAAMYGDEAWGRGFYEGFVSEAER